MEQKKKQWGYLRETKEKAQKAGIDTETGLCRTGLEEYLKAVFPHVNDWISNKKVEGLKRNFRPDYRSEQLKLIIEFDGLPHYTNPLNIHLDEEKTKYYQDAGYKVVRIPFFIQLSNKVVKRLFGVDVAEPLFDENYASLGASGKNTPAFLCSAGIKRMAKEFYQLSPEQYDINIAALEKGEYYLTEVNVLKKEYNALSQIKDSQKE